MILEQTGQLAPANNPVQLIRDAIGDLELQEKEPQVLIDMGAWHEPDYNRPDRCYQCLAGASMSRRLGLSLEEQWIPDELPEKIRNKIQALNFFRMGQVRLAFKTLGLIGEEEPIVLPAELEWRAIPCYGDSPEGFKKEMLKLADDIEAFLNQNN